MFNSGNFVAWMVQAFILVSAGSLLLRLVRVRHPRTELAFCHALLAVCLLLPLLQPWRHPVVEVSSSSDDLTVAPPRNPGADAGLTSVPAAVAAKTISLPAHLEIPWGRIIRW